MPRPSYLSQLAHPASGAIPLRPPNALVRRWAHLESLRPASEVAAVPMPVRGSQAIGDAGEALSAPYADEAIPARAHSVPSALSAADVPVRRASALNALLSVPAFEPVERLSYPAPRPIPPIRPADVEPAPVARSLAALSSAAPPPTAPGIVPNQAPAAPTSGPTPRVTLPPDVQLPTSPTQPVASRPLAAEAITVAPSRAQADVSLARRQPPAPRTAPGETQATARPPGFHTPERSSTSLAGSLPLVPQELVPAARPAPSPRILVPERRATVHIGAVEVRITPPAAEHAPAQVQVSVARRVAPASPPAPLSRGFTSVFGLRQG